MRGAAERAKAFAARQVKVDARECTVHAFDLSEYRYTLAKANQTATFAREAIADALEAYEAEAWTRITDDPATWPTSTWCLVLIDPTQGGILEPDADSPIIGARWRSTTTRPFPYWLAWRPMPAGPKELRDDG